MNTSSFPLFPKMLYNNSFSIIHCRISENLMLYNFPKIRNINGSRVRHGHQLRIVDSNSFMFYYNKNKMSGVRNNRKTDIIVIELV